MYPKYLKSSAPVFAQDACLIVGAPAAGKSTTAEAAARETGSRLMSIDDFVSSVYDPIVVRRPMTDSEVDAALKLLIAECQKGDLIEYSHHDYMSSLANIGAEVSRNIGLAFVLAPEKICLDRNNRRISPVPTKYLLRCLKATEVLLDHVRNLSTIRYCVIDTSELDREQSAGKLVHFIGSNPSGPL